MSYTNSTPNYNLPQWIGTDKPTFLGDFNGAFSAIDTAMKDNADTSSAATSTANAANATAVSANTNANTALNTANNAKDTADAATAAAAGATSTANTAKTTADNAARAALSNNVSNLAPAYDPTLTYAVGDLVTYIDENNTGKLYKCIVPVNTPMAFNVNYWDDVTVSEVVGGFTVLATVTTDGVKTYKQLYDELSVQSGLQLPDSEFTKHCRFVVEFSDGVSSLSLDEISATRLRFGSVTPASTAAYLSGVIIGRGAANISENSKGVGTITPDVGYAYTDLSPTVPVAGQKYSIVLEN